MAASRVGVSLKAARERLGWSREALAYQSGLSWAAIAQIESGRRREVRLGSLVALANALGVSVDYLVGAEATVSPKLLGHCLFVYGSDEEYLATAAPFVAGGVERDESVLVVSGRHQIRLLREAIGDDASQVDFKDAAKWYSTGYSALSGYRSYVKERFANGAHWTRILGEPIWKGRPSAEVTEWIRYESMLNVSLASAPTTILCPYDARSAHQSVVSVARHTHPQITEAGSAAISSFYREPEAFLLPTP